MTATFLVLGTALRYGRIIQNMARIQSEAEATSVPEGPEAPYFYQPEATPSQAQNLDMEIKRLTLPINQSLLNVTMQKILKQS